MRRAAKWEQASEHEWVRDVGSYFQLWVTAFDDDLEDADGPRWSVEAVDGAEAVWGHAKTVRAAKKKAEAALGALCREALKSLGGAPAGMSATEVVGRRVVFITDVMQGPDDYCPGRLYARKGAGGTVLKPDTPRTSTALAYAILVKPDDGPKFWCDGSEFEVQP